ncbi:MAG: hypothetical protein Q8Q25_03040 [bacterium]|nr:hypothetical protein [bacterium]
MNEHPFHRLIDLIDFDQSIRIKQKTIDELTNHIEKLQKKIDEQNEQLEYAKRMSLDARKAVDQIELEVHALAQEEKDKKRRSEGITHYKEQQSLQAEITRLQEAQNEREQVLLETWNKLESAQRELTARQKEYDEKMTVLSENLQEKQQQLVIVQKELDEHVAGREQKEKGVPEEWLEKYNSMRARVSDPVVMVEDASCGACFHTISNQDMVRLKRGALLQCKGCYRFLYIKEVMERSMNSESGTDEAT